MSATSGPPMQLLAPPQKNGPRPRSASVNASPSRKKLTNGELGEMHQKSVSTQNLATEQKDPAIHMNGDAKDFSAALAKMTHLIPGSMSSLAESDDPVGWQNEAYGLFTEKTGDEMYERLTSEQFKNAEIEQSGVFSSLEEKFKELKLNFQATSTLTQDGVEGIPHPVGGSGFAKIVSNPKFPPHPFFQASRFFRIRLRHNNLSYEDDARLDGRVTCLKFCDRENGGPLDVIFHTGKVPQYYTASTFEDFMKAFKKGSASLRNWVFERPINYYSRVENVRRAPNSYYDQRYYSQVTYNFQALDGVHRVARLRLVPADGCTQTGKPDKKDQENVWDTERRSDEKRGKNYLQKEYMQRLDEHPLQYRLQIQVRELEPKKSPEVSQEALTLQSQTSIADEDELWERPVDGVNTNDADGSFDLQKAQELMDKFQIYNSCLEWNSEDYPWLDLAIVTVTTPMSEKQLRKTKFLLTNRVQTFSPALPISTQGFRSLVLPLKEFHGIAEHANGVSEVSDIPVEISKVYKIAVVTGKVTNAGTDADVFITIAGSNGKTRPINLDQKFHDDFEPGQTDEFEETGNNVGEVTVIEMAIGSSILSRRWFLEEVTVTDLTTMSKVRFPCYQWLTSRNPSVVLRRADALAPQDDLQIFPYLIRKFEIAQRRQKFQWEDVQGFPGRIKAERYDELPTEVHIPSTKESDPHARFAKNLSVSGAGNILNFLNWNIFEDNPKMISKFPVDFERMKKVIAHWRNDEEFGRQVLNGAHPCRIERVQALPHEFSHKKDVIESFMNRKLTLDEEIEDGRVYLLTYPELDNLVQESVYKGKFKRYVTSPSCLLYVRKDTHLVPIAITLSQEDTPLVWTPKDDMTDWLMAKMWVRLADAHIHLICSHHLYSQLVMEAFAVATFRNLPSAHPVFKLLHPHIRYAIPLSFQSRKHLYAPEEGLFSKFLSAGGQHMKLIKSSYRHFSLGDLNIPLDLQNRGVHDPDKLPNYFYRDDCQRLWDIIKKLVRTVLHITYWSDFSVQADEEIQAWVQDIHEHGLPVWELGIENNVPYCLRTIDQAVEFVTIIIFTASCQYAALTSGMMDTYGFIPNAPTMLLSPPARERRLLREADMKKALPNKSMGGEIIAACCTLTGIQKNEVPLGEFPEQVWSDKAIIAAIDGFKVDLSRLEEKILARNAELEMPYPYMLPSRLSKSAAC